MTPKSSRRVAILLVTTALADTGCGGGNDASPASPSNVPSVIQGTVGLGGFQFAVVQFSVDRAGTLSSRVDWNTATNDLDTALLRGRCTVDQVLAEASGCNGAALIASDEGSGKPSVLNPSVQSGEHTLLIFNFGPGADTSSYRLEGFVSGATNPATSSPASSVARRTDTFAFTLSAGTTAATVAGPVRAGNGQFDVTLNFSGSYLILACIGPSSACTLMVGRPTTRSFNIPADFPAGPIRASVYFNPNVAQPPGNAAGTVSFTYAPF